MQHPLNLREIGSAEFAYITGVLHQETGIRLQPGKEALVAGRLDKRLRSLGLAGYPEYVRYLRTQPESGPEMIQLINLLTTNETFFFRERQHFDFLRDVVVPARDRGRPLRLWSAASSSGEEAYTAAMVLSETLLDHSWEIVGTDISRRVVENARRGIYPLAAADRIPRQLLRKYWLRGREEYDGSMAVNRRLRERVRFHHDNLMGRLSHHGRFDVILLRNVMIYFDLETKRELVLRLQEMLQPGGYLIVGRSESLNSIPSRLQMIEPSIYRAPGQSRG
ncbi:CheR family methyltransferase [Actinoplanes regularis]|uniref:protein-glutamate O-methyltransferase n=1 Tax=Actinoplanes regularis TaxID=52697 RepID=A0A238YZT5_9ACTN|nr:protein-glutamate O-methyltransferase CheR [Actinoplanes regularis]GIE85695.1 chemotaxis protein methyltransferase [Actinoplanes regularis]SNR76597.1 chemotaxis protein methyltransferase CheR [Actinoplanes regularis]